ncbi:hypothetical protein CRUP_025821 [Coryphaenoides rupestris]|nr:hypothetical protein CRUP_025821 [Coryphaenoides rupestris]
MKKQQKKRADTHMVTANSDARLKHRKHKPCPSDDTALLINQSQSNTSLSDLQVDRGHDNPLEEITLGEHGFTSTMTSDEGPAEKPPGAPRTFNLLEVEPEAAPKQQVEEEKRRLETHASQPDSTVVEFAGGEVDKTSEDDEERKREQRCTQVTVPPAPRKKQQLSTSRCQISDEESGDRDDVNNDSDDDDDEVQEKERTSRKKKKKEESKRSLALLNSNFRERSSSGSDSIERSASPISVEDLEKFALRSAPRDQTIQCRITRDRRGVEKGMFPTYYLHMEKNDGKRVFLMAGRKRKKCKTSNYLISIDPTDLTRDTHSYIGKLR